MIDVVALEVTESSAGGVSGRYRFHICNSLTQWAVCHHPCGQDLAKTAPRLLMQRRREHIECESRPGLGCLVYGTSICIHRKKLRLDYKRWLRTHVTVELWLILLALVPVLFGMLWVARTANQS